MQQLRDTFLDAIFRRFPEFDQAEIQEIMMEFKMPYVELANQNPSLDYVSVSEPWSFSRLRVNEPQMRGVANPEENSVASLQMQTQQSLPDMARLSLEKPSD